MSSLINSFLIEPVVRQARRFSFARSTGSEASISSGRLSSLPRVIDSGPLADAPAGDCSVTRVEGSDGLAQGIPGTDGHGISDDVPTERTFIQDGASGQVIPHQDVRGDILFEEPHTFSSTEQALIHGPDHHLLSTSDEDVSLAPTASLRSLSIDTFPSMTSNPSYTSSGRLRATNPDDTDARSSALSTRSRASTDGSARPLRTDVNSAPSSGALSSSVSLSGVTANAATTTTIDTNDSLQVVMSGLLPADDGMRTLREQMHAIREMALSTEDKAKRMHALMVADYQQFRETHGAQAGSDRSSTQAQRPGEADTEYLERLAPRIRSPSPRSGGGDETEDLNPTAEDLQRTYHERSEGEGCIGEDGNPEPPALGCRHYMRNVKIRCADCGRWYSCRHCHDEAEAHPLNRKKIRRMLCMLCGTAQPAAEYCTHCGELTAAYYCDICKLWDGDASHSIYHCHDCGICRRGEGLGRDYVHCKKCNVCINISFHASHRCVERATESDCPICGDYLFNSSASVVAMRCGHYIHRACYDAYMLTSYRCPLCSRSAVNMELQWRKLDRHIDAQPMPPQFARTRAWVLCNDCGGRSLVRYHWLGNRCATCDSYNTNELRLVTDDAAADADASAGNPSGAPADAATPGHQRSEELHRPAAPTDIAMLDAPSPPPPPSPPTTRTVMVQQQQQQPHDTPTQHLTAESDDLSFWGDVALAPGMRALSPARWGLPLSPASSWARRSPLLRGERGGGGDDSMSGDGDEDDEDDDDEEEEEEVDDGFELEDAGEDEEGEGEGDGMELFGHR